MVVQVEAADRPLGEHVGMKGVINRPSAWNSVSVPLRSGPGAVFALVITLLHSIHRRLVEISFTSKM